MSEWRSLEWWHPIICAVVAGLVVDGVVRTMATAVGLVLITRPRCDH